MTTIIKFLIAGVGVFLAGLSSAVYASNDVMPDDAAPFTAYQSFLGARSQASSVEDIYAYLPSAQVKQLEAMPPEQLEGMSRMLFAPQSAEDRQPTADEIVLADVMEDGSSAQLMLETESVENDVRTAMTATVDMVHESDGWKVTDPRPASWRVTSRMPATQPATPAVAKAGPGRTDWPGVVVTSPAQFKLITERKLEAVENPNKMRWDPNGNYLLIGNNNKIANYALPDLQPLWSGWANSTFFGGTLSHDGRSYLTEGRSRLPIRIDLALNAALDAPPDAPFFEGLDLAPKRDSIGEVYRYGLEQYHPQQDVAAFALSGESGDVIAFTGSADTPADIPAETPEGSLVWAPDGSALAYTSRFRQPGGATVVHAYPEGNVLQRLSVAEFSPGSVLFSRDAKSVANVGGNNDGNMVAVWTVGSGESLATLDGLEKVVFGSDSGQIFGVRAAGASVEEGISDTLVIYDIAGGTEVASFTAFPKGDHTYPANISLIGISPNGRYLAVVARQNREHILRLWEITEEL
ncbi:WD40 repeat domain-containing protein [Lentisalinibacter sediminis]|uniref:WD40 repeat domain-containing protein n=1 Tax=Lentisalinibacter sediminis TaxID=2992237 RepID=UPI0038704E58